MEIDKRALGQRIKSIRQSKGLTMEQFGKLFDNASKGVVSNWEKGSNVPNNERLKMIATAGGITVDELLHGSRYEYAYRLFNELYDNLDDSKKILSEAKRNELIDEFLQRATKPIYSSESGEFSSKYEEYLKFMFEVCFDGYYVKEVISNENAISLVINKLESIQLFINDYFSYDLEKTATTKIEKLDSDLEVELHDLIEDARISAEHLSYKYKKN